jgi:hypothetical protein
MPLKGRTIKVAQTPVVDLHANKRVQRSPDPKNVPKLEGQNYERLHAEASNKSKGNAIKVA